MLDAHAAPAAEAARARLLGLAGLPGDVHKVLTLNDPVLPPSLEGWTAFRMHDTTNENLRERLAGLAGPVEYILYGQAALLEWMAVEVERAGGRFRCAAAGGDHQLGPPHRSGRARIESAFGSPVHSWYGSRRQTPPSRALRPASASAI